MSRDLDDIRELDARLIIYAGPELSRSAGIPGPRELVDELLGAAEDFLSGRQHRELAALAEAGPLGDVFAELERAMTSAAFGDVVERVLDDKECEVPPLAQAIARLGRRVRGVITVNLDLLMERAFAGLLAVHPAPAADLGRRSDWLLKLHGTLHDRSSWMLTSRQRARALHRDPLHRELFRSLFFSHPVLFVATRLDDPVLIQLVEQITSMAAGQAPRHWALVNRDEAGPIARRKFAAAGIRLIPFDDPDRDLTGCVRLLDALALTGPSPASVLGDPDLAPPPVRREGRSAGVSASTLVQSKPTAVLFLAANPAGTDPLRVDRELRVIRDAIERSRYRANLHLEVRTAATIHDLRRALLDEPYDIVHISGHGERGALLLEDDQGQCVEVPKQGLARLFGRYAARGSLRCVVLNACWSVSIGEQPEMSVAYTIAMDGEISDVGAVEFARGFYDALGAGMPIPEAHEEGMTAVALAAPGVAFECLLRQGPS